MGLRKATRQKAKVRIGLSGPSGSGKTYSALLIAAGMAPMDKVAVIDTENGSADLYSHLGDYSVITLQAPYAPERYVQAIEECQAAGMEVIIIDSVSHEWDGKGGCLESNDLLGQTRFKGNNWAAWSVTTPRHQKFIEAITSSPCHIITTARSKTDTIQTEDKKVKKIGLKEIQREGFEFELTVNFTLDREGHYAMASKDRTAMFSELDPFKITKETGKMIMDWANSGVEPLPPPPPAVMPPIGEPDMRVGAGMPTSEAPAAAPLWNPATMSATQYLEIINERSTAEDALLKLYAAAKMRSDFPLEDRVVITKNYLSHLAEKRGMTVTTDGRQFVRADGTVAAVLTYTDGWVSFQKPPTPPAGDAPAPAQPSPPPPAAPAPQNGDSSPQGGDKPGTTGGTTPVTTPVTTAGNNPPASSREMSGDQWVRLQDAAKKAGVEPVQLEEMARKHFTVARAAELHPEAAESLIIMLERQAAGGANVDTAAEALAVLGDSQEIPAGAQRMTELGDALAAKLAVSVETASMAINDIADRLFPDLEGPLTPAQEQQLIDTVIKTYSLTLSFAPAK